MVLIAVTSIRVELASVGQGISIVSNAARTTQDAGHKIEKSKRPDVLLTERAHTIRFVANCIFSVVKTKSCANTQIRHEMVRSSWLPINPSDAHYRPIGTAVVNFVREICIRLSSTLFFAVS